MAHRVDMLDPNFSAGQKTELKIPVISKINPLNLERSYPWMMPDLTPGILPGCSGFLSVAAHGVWVSLNP
jgi:hypothetical protein